MKTNRYTGKSKTASLRKSVLSVGLHDPWAGLGAPKTGAFRAAKSFGRGGDWRGLVAVLAISGAVAGAGLFRVWTRAETQHLGYLVVSDESRIRNAESERDRLSIEAASLSSPIRIAKLANMKLGLKTPSADQIVNLDGALPDEPAIATSLARR